jgi:hypothetical protein
MKRKSTHKINYETGANLLFVDLHARVLINCDTVFSSDKFIDTQQTFTAGPGRALLVVLAPLALVQTQKRPPWTTSHLCCDASRPKIVERVPPWVEGRRKVTASLTKMDAVTASVSSADRAHSLHNLIYFTINNLALIYGS